MRRIGDVAEAIFKIAQCNNGTEIFVYKDLQLLEYGELLADLCDPHRQVELTIVFNHTKQQWLRVNSANNDGNGHIRGHRSV